MIKNIFLRFKNSYFFAHPSTKSKPNECYCLCQRYVSYLTSTIFVSHSISYNVCAFTFTFTHAVYFCSKFSSQKFLPALHFQWNFVQHFKFLFEILSYLQSKFIASFRWKCPVETLFCVKVCKRLHISFQILKREREQKSDEWRKL